MYVLAASLPDLLPVIFQSLEALEVMLGHPQRGSLCEPIHRCSKRRACQACLGDSKAILQ